VEGLKRRKEDGYLPVLAVLCLTRFSNLILAKADSIPAGNVDVDSLRSRRLSNLEGRINDSYDGVIKEHYEGALREGQVYLDNILRGKGIEVKKC
jgi:hypothetical protein